MASSNTRPKFVMLGKTYVGKSSIVIRLLTSAFREYLEPTQADFYNCKRQVGERTIHFDIWDTAGQERFKSLLPMYIRGATVAVVVFDVNDPLSLEDAVVHMKENDKIPIIALVANKADLLTDPAHDPIIAEAIKQSDIFNANFFLVSAKTGQGINKMFDALAMAAAKYLAQAGDPILDAPAPSGTVNLDPDHHTNRKARSFNCWSFLSGWWGSSSALTPATETSDTSSSSM